MTLDRDALHEQVPPMESASSSGGASPNRGPSTMHLTHFLGVNGTLRQIKPTSPRARPFDKMVIMHLHRVYLLKNCPLLQCGIVATLAPPLILLFGEDVTGSKISTVLQSGRLCAVSA